MSDDIKHTLGRLETKVDKINEHISKIEITLGKQHTSLEHHIKRTNLLEQAFKPLNNHVQSVQAIVKFVIWLTGCAFAMSLGVKVWALLNLSSLF
jgi:hypothetical protein